MLFLHFYSTMNQYSNFTAWTKLEMKPFPKTAHTDLIDIETPCLSKNRRSEVGLRLQLGWLHLGVMCIIFNKCYVLFYYSAFMHSPIDQFLSDR